MNLTNEINKIVANLNNKEFKTVINSCENLIKSKVENTIIYNLYGQAYQNLAFYEKSIEKFEKSLELNNNNYFALNNIAISFKATEKFLLSEKAYKQCLKIKPDFVVAIINYANLKEFLNQIHEAIDLNLSALEHVEETKKAHLFSKLCRLYMSIGKIKDARKYSIKLLEKYPTDTSFYELHSEIADFKKDKKYLSDMEDLYENKNLTENEIINLAFPLGKAYEKLKVYQKAYAYFTKGNELKKKKIYFNLDELYLLTESIKEVFNRINFDKIKKNTFEKKLIFICGMPRSGTTLIEQIVSSHSDVIPIGEYNYLSTFIKKNYMNNFSLDEKRINKDIFLKDNLFQDYVLNLFKEFNYKSKTFTDKSIQNFLWVGFIKIFFPNAKIIFTDRNARDVCLSIFKINFKNGFMNFAYDQKDIANFYNIYLDLINFWKEIFKKEIFTVKYENLIDNPEPEIRKIIDFCGLKWDPNCLKHDQNKFGIATASINQARQPIYTSSKNVYKNYSNYLVEMFSNLKN